MVIKEIELYNFKLYKGRNIINLLPKDDEIKDDNKNIIIISGKNGYGKTTFLVSLVWCLYGKQMGKVDDLYQKEISDKGTYPKYIADCLNRKAKLEGKTTFKVAITLEGVKIPDIECKEVKIIRSYDIATSSSDKIKILIDGYENQITRDLGVENQNGEEVFIRDFILPIEIAKFFLFDAEKIVALAEVNSLEQRKQLSRAYSEVLGIKKYEDLKNEIEGILDEYRKKSAKPEDKQRLNSIEAEIENCNIEEKNLIDKIDELKEEKDEKKKESEEIQIKLIQEGKTMTIEELNSLKQEKEILDNQVESLQTEIKSLYDFIPFGLAGEVLADLSEQLQQEQEIQSLTYKQEDFKEKIDKLINDVERERELSHIPFDKKIIDFYSSQIAKQIKKYFFSDIPETPENFQSLHEITTSEYNELIELISRLKHSFKERFERINNDFSIKRTQLEAIQRKIRDAEKEAEDDYIRSLRERKEILDKKIKEVENEISNLEISNGGIKEKLKRLRTEQGILRKNIDDLIDYTDKENVYKQTLKLIKSNIQIFRQEKKKSLEKNMLDGLDVLLHKKEFIKKVSVDISQSGEDIDITLYNDRYEKIDKASLSMGERQVYASALLNALVDESNIEFPVFIDSPMQKFDEEHAENIIKYFYPNVSKQVVIFPLLGRELTMAEYEILKDKVCKTFLIQNLNPDVSKFMETSPEKLMETYKEI